MPHHLLAGQHRWRRLSLTALGVTVLPFVALAAAVAGAVAALPAVGGAPRLAERIAARQHQTAGLPVPSRLAEAAIASEDGRFRDPVVINVTLGAMRAAASLIQGNSDPGGATIDQQLAKALYGQGSGITGTLRQIGLGIKLGLRYSDRELLAMYLNVNYYGNGLWGVREAAHGYFDKRPAELSWGQAAMLAGLLQAPSADDPLRHHPAARARQRYVLQRLVADGVLSAARAHAAFISPLHLRRGPERHTPKASAADATPSTTPEPTSVG